MGTGAKRTPEQPEKPPKNEICPAIFYLFVRVPVYNLNTAYNLLITPRQLTVSAAFNVALSDGAALQTRTFGPTLAMGKQFFDKKLRTQLSVSHNQTQTEQKNMGRILNGRLSGAWSWKKKHNINFGVVMMNRTNRTEQQPGMITEYTGTLGYAYAF